MKLILILISTTLVGCSTVGDPLEKRIQADRNATMARIQADLDARKARADNKRAEENVTCSKLSDMPQSLSLQEITKIQDAVKDQLKDPWSAHFKDIQGTSLRRQCSDRVWGRQIVIAKGFVNSKNSYGGYAGWKNINLYSSGNVEIYG